MAKPSIEELQNQIEKLKQENLRLKHGVKQQRFGLVWMDVQEAYDTDIENKLPILEEVNKKAIINDDGKPTHILIEGDNYHALTCLNYTHKEKVDVIYIDPPYNTGSDGFRYKDKRFIKEFPDGTTVPVDSPFRHSYWLSFMYKRLELAKNLLNKNGVIFISIDDNEEAHLRIICDQVFGEKNFIAKLIWQQGKKHIGSFIGVNHEYMIAYAKDKNFINDNKNKWKQKKEGLDDIYKEYEKLKKLHKNNYSLIAEGLKTFFNSLAENNPTKEHKHYNQVDSTGIYFPGDLSQGTGNGPKYEVIHPITHKPCTIPAGGWRYKFETMQKLLDENKIHFSDDEKTVPCRKRYLKDTEYELPPSVFYKDGRGASKFLLNLLGEKKFNNPKDIDVLKRILNFKKNQIILDFFAGSGSTAQAVMELNENDNVKRQWILVTNNENMIMDDICYPRIHKIIHGCKLTKNQTYEPLGNSLRYYKTAFIGKNNILNISDEDKTELAHNAGYLLAIAENTLNEIERTEYYQFFKNEKLTTAIYYREDLKVFSSFVRKIEDIKTSAVVYIFSWGDASEFESSFERLKNVRLKNIPAPILEIYKQIYNTNA